MRICASLITVCILACGCTQRSTYYATDSDIDKPFFYYEQDRYNQPHALSNVDMNDSEPNRIPNPALVDLDSCIHIRVSKPSS